jgi:hypothetical protein
VLIALDWGDFPLYRRALRAGDALRLPEAAHTVRVDRAGRVSLTADGADPEPLIAPRRLGALTVSAAPLGEHSFGAAPWHRDLVGASALFAHFGAIAAVALAQPTFGAFPEEVDRAALAPDAMVVTHAHAARLSFELSPDWRAMPAPEAMPELEGAQHMLLPEAPAAERGPWLAGQRARAYDQRPGGTGARAQLGAGPIGNPSAPDALGTWTLARRHDDASVRLAKESRVSGLEFTGHFSAIQPHPYTRHWGLSRDHDEGAEVIVSTLGAVDTEGLDDDDIVGNMFGPEPTDPRGSGLATAGVGPGGSGEAGGPGLGRVGAQGHGAGSGWDQGRGVRDASPFTRSGRLGEHVPRAPSLATRVSRDAAERVIARAKPRLRACGAQPAGIDFTITPEGRTANITIDGSGADADVGIDADANARAACLRRVVDTLRFPTANSASHVRVF